MKMKVYGVDAGFGCINYVGKNREGERIFYGFQQGPGGTFYLYRLCRNLEPSHRAHARIPLDQLFELPTGGTQLEVDLYEFLTKEQ